VGAAVDLNDALKLLEAARGNPDAMAIATLDIVLASHEPALKSALQAAAIPHWFTEPTLRTLLGDAVPQQDEWFNDLLRMTVVEQFHAHNAWNIHEVTRLALRDRLAADNPQRFQALGSRAAEIAAGDEWADAVERVYHLLTANPEHGASELRRLWKRWSRLGKRQPLQALGRALDELNGRKLLQPKPRAYALVALCTIREGHSGVAALEQMAREALELMTRADDSIGLVDAYGALGRVLRVQGRQADALTAFDSARERLQQIAVGEIDEDERTFERADIHLGVGRILGDRGQLGESLAEFEAAWTLRKQLCNAAPNDKQRQYELAVAYADLGDALAPTARADEAEQNFITALELLEASRSPELGAETIDWGIVRLRYRLVNMLSIRGNVAESLKQLHEAGEVARRLRQMDPEHLEWKSDLAHYYLQLSGFQFQRGEVDESERSMTTAREMYGDLAERDPGSPEWKRALGALHTTFAYLRQQQGRYLDAMTEHQEAERRLAELAAADPDRADLKLAVVAAQQGIARLVRMVVDALDDDTKKASSLMLMLGKLASAKATVAELAERDRGNVSWKRTLAASHRELANGLESVAKHVKSGVKLGVDVDLEPDKLYFGALSGYSESAKILAELRAQDHDNTDYTYDLISSVKQGAGVFETINQAEDALNLYRMALEPARELLVVDSTNEAWKRMATSIEAAIERLQGQKAAPEH
jgi:tetratricopeptide (TPR) repeat protein